MKPHAEAMIPSCANNTSYTDSSDRFLSDYEFNVIDHWFVTNKASIDPQKKLLLLFPAIGTGASMFSHLLRQPPMGFETIAVQLPGREHRQAENCFTDVKALYAGLARPLKKLLASRKFSFYGHSFGGIMAYEMAIRMSQHGLNADNLFVSSSRPPPLCEAWCTEDSNNAYRLTDEAYNRLMASISSSINEEKREMVLGLFFKDLIFLSSYRHLHDEPLATPITALVGDCDPIVTAAEMSAWAALSSCGFEQKKFRGDHWFIMRAKMKAELKRILASENGAPKIINWRKSVNQPALY